MPRYAFKIEYDGAPFVGWQRQANLSSVQGTLEAALAKVGEVGKVQAAGRTDTGVHALGQVGHYDAARDWDPFRLSEAVNFHLKPAPVAVTECARVPDDWHARFSAQRRHYRYRIASRRAPLTHAVGKFWRVGHPLSVPAMRVAAQTLLGTHDFTTFRSTMCQADSPVKTLDAIEISEHPYTAGIEYRFEVTARSFLHNQVRSLVGTLERVGVDRWTPEDVRSALEARDRAACGPVAPPDGLYLVHVDYAHDPFA
jgi:tRNA pseudouridine38-40 synthase